MTREERTTYWRKLVDEQVESGLSASAFCNNHDLKLSQFYRWRRHFRNQQANPRSPGFLKLVASSKSNGSGIVIHLHNGMSIQVERDFDPYTLRSVIEAIGRK